jgi:molybdopterin synthase catalytic subunit
MTQQASGSGWFVEVTDQPLDIGKYTQLVTDPAAGAISSFIGTTRNNFQGKAVLRLEYEAYAPMAVAKLKVTRLLLTVLRDWWVFSAHQL